MTMAVCTHLDQIKLTEPVGARYSVTSRDLRILMEQPTEPIPSHDTPTRHEDHGFARPKRRRLPQRAMRTVDVVVIGILTEHAF
jgi:hypothetical protein